MELSQDNLLKFFYSNNERMECYIVINTKSNKKSKDILALTVTLNKPISINIYIVQSGERGEIKRKLVSSAKSLSSVNCHDYDGIPSYDIEFCCTDGKVKRIFASLIEDKHRFIERLMRVMYLLSIHLFSTVQFNNIPGSINIENIYTEGNVDKNDGEVDKIYGDSVLVDATDFSRYQNLSSAEEENLQKFLNESPEAVVSALEFQEKLKRHLLTTDSTNVHSIMNSEKEMLHLMEMLDCAIKNVEILESRIEIQDQFLAEVEDSMTCLRDRDDLVRLTAKNRDNVLETLSNVLYQITLEDRHCAALRNINFSSPDSVQEAFIGAEKLQMLLKQPITEGLEKMSAVKEKLDELTALADEFARIVATQFNSALMRYVNKLMAVSASHLDKIVEMHCTNREELNIYIYFLAWLKNNRPKLFHDIQKVYVDKLCTVYEQEISSMVEQVKGKLITKDRNASAAVNKTQLSHPIGVRLQERTRSKNNSESSSMGHPDSGRFEMIFEDFLSKLKPLVLEEEQFVTRLLRLDCRRASERPDHLTPKPPTSTDNNGYLFNVSGLIFRSLSTQLKALMVALEQHEASQSLQMVVVVNRQFSDEAIKTSEFLQVTWGVLFMQSKLAFNSYIDKLCASFKEVKAPKKPRCGILPFVSMYGSFAEQTTLAFQGSMRQNDLITAHLRIIREIISQIERIANESTKTPKEVIIMENHHQMKDTLRHLKWPELEELYEELKDRYQQALDDYVTKCVGRPFEKLYIFFEHVTSAIESGIKSEDIGYQFQFSRLELRKVVHEYPGREVKRGLDHLCRKVEKYVSEDSGLFQVVWLSVQKQFMAECLHYESLIDSCYPNSNIKLEFTRTELEQFFKEIAAAR